MYSYKTMKENDENYAKISKIIKEELKLKLEETSRKQKVSSEMILKIAKLNKKLIMEGRTIEDSLDLSENILGDLWQSLKLGTLTDAAGSMIREYIISFLLSILNINKKTGEFLKTVLADVEPKKILMIFKNKEFCLREMPALTDAILEGIIGQIQYSADQSSLQNFSPIVKSGVRNTIGEIIKDSNIGETISARICDVIWKEDGLK